MDEPDVILRWAEPLVADSEPVDPEMRAELAAVAAEAAVINEARLAVARAAGRWTETPPSMSRYLTDLVMERLHRVPRLVCPHDGAVRKWTIYSGPFIALACDDPICQEALDRHIIDSSHLEYCDLCMARGGADMDVLVIPIIPGVIQMVVHVACVALLHEQYESDA